MPDEQAPGATQETPVTESAPEEGHAPQAETQEQIDFEKRYNDLRPEYDRGQQELSQLKEFFGHLTNPETQAQALAQFGIELQQEQQAEEDEQNDPYDQRLSAMEQYLIQQREAQEAAQQDFAVTQHIHDGIAQLQDKLGREFTEKELDVLVPLCEAIPGQDGMPNVSAAYERLYDGMLPDQQKSWLKTKPRKNVLSDGQSAEQAPDRATRKGRLDFALQKLQAQQDE